MHACQIMVQNQTQVVVGESETLSYRMAVVRKWKVAAFLYTANKDVYLIKL